MYSLLWRPPPLETGLENMYRVEIHVHGPIFHFQLKKKIRPITLIVSVLGRVKKCLKKGQKNEKNILFFLNKYQNVTYVSTCILQGHFKNIVFSSVALLLIIYYL